jgi:hypothetical protein
LFRDSSLAHAFENWPMPGQIPRVIAYRRKDGAGAGDSESWVERETGFDGGMRFVKSTKLRKGGGQLKICSRIVSVGLDRPSTPRDRLLKTA